MKKEYDFPKGERGKFYRPGAELNPPIYLEPELRKYFPDAESVNKVLRCLLPLLSSKGVKRRLEES
jgi:hypothetical protein